MYYIVIKIINGGYSAQLFLEWSRCSRVILFYEPGPGVNCEDIKNRGNSKGDGLYWLVPDEGSHSNAFLAYCDMTSYNGGWTMCYTTDEYVKPKTEVTYSAQLPYGSDGYRTNCNNIPVSFQ